MVTRLQGGVVSTLTETLSASNLHLHPDGKPLHTVQRCCSADMVEPRLTDAHADERDKPCHESDGEGDNEQRRLEDCSWVDASGDHGEGLQARARER